VGVLAVRKAFEDSLRRIDELIRGHACLLLFFVLITFQVDTDSDGAN
jgi:hypothetical protein